MTVILETKRFQDFLTIVRGHVYSEPDTNIHTNVINTMSEKIVQAFYEDKDGALLDVGCGSGYAMEKMKELGMTNLQGITLSHDDAEMAKSRGFTVTEQDMSFTDFADGSFKYLWVRHALEHSPFPLLTLLEFNRLLEPNGRAYIEMPSPKCTRVLEQYDNHYSIMGQRQWEALMVRAGFIVGDVGEIKFDVKSDTDPDFFGTEVYEWYVLIKNP